MDDLHLASTTVGSPDEGSQKPLKEQKIKKRVDKLTTKHFGRVKGPLEDHLFSHLTFRPWRAATKLDFSSETRQHLWLCCSRQIFRKNTRSIALETINALSVLIAKLKIFTDLDRISQAVILGKQPVDGLAFSYLTSR